MIVAAVQRNEKPHPQGPHPASQVPGNVGKTLQRNHCFLQLQMESDLLIKVLA
jgi:hypothetical protein